MSRVFAYCRVSTLEQTTENQRREIEAAGFAVKPQRLIEEHVSGSVAASERPGFARLLDRMENGDVLIVTKLDRLGRNAMDIRKTVEQLAVSDIRVHCLALGGVDLTSPAGKMTMQVISAVAEFERDLLLERTHSGIARAKAAGKRFGRPSALNEEQQLTVIARINAGNSISRTAFILNVNVATTLQFAMCQTFQRKIPESRVEEDLCTAPKFDLACH
ncbi:recombinase family protein [Pseudocitrobacter corydidari]